MKRTLTMALCAPLVLIATSCASEADDGAVEVRTGAAATQALRAAPDAVGEAGTASVEMVMEMTVQGQDLEMRATGAMDSEAQQMSMELDMGAMFRGLAEQTGESLPEGLDEPMRLVADGTTMYVQMPFAALLGAPSGWLSMDLAEMGAGPDPLGAGAYDLRSTLETLRGTTGEPEVVGTEEVRGVETTHYTATVDLAKALEEAPESARAALEQLGGSDALDGAELVVDIWIDADGLPRRQTMDMGGAFGAMGLGTGTATMTIEYFDYGEPVDIEVPAPEDVTPFSEVMGGFGEALGGAGS
jgi:hypothetical protein